MFLGLDIGSSAVKAILLDLERGVVAAASAPVALHSPAAGWAEADTGEWWDAVSALVPQLLDAAEADAGAIEGVAVAGMVPALVALDAAGRPLRRAILQNDARATAEVARLRAELAGADLLARTGSVLSQQSIAPTLCWLREHEPATMAAASSLAGSYEWIARRLGAEPHLERNWAIESGLFELDGTPAADVIAAAEIDPGLLPPVREAGEAVGVVGEAAAGATGLRAGTPIFVGLADHVSSAYGAGMLDPGEVLVKLGGAGDILLTAAEPLVDERLYLDKHPVGSLWLPNGCMATSGSLVRWLQRLSGGTPLERLDREAEAVAPGAEGVVCLPYFLGEKSPLHDPDQRGAFVGLGLSHGLPHLYRAALEAVAFGFRHHFEVFADLGVATTVVRVTNGGSRSTLWKSIIADVLGRPLVPIVDHPGASLGAAMAAAVGSGAAGWTAIADLVGTGDPIEPRPENRDRYDSHYEIYRGLEPALRPFAHRLAGAADRTEAV
ncbi:MAG: carbohydrate kinase [Actinobacteria bacterium]|nr:carbohydrate kinase [Actinomycetota bacterium]